MDERLLTLFMLLGYIYKFILIIIPILIILIGTIDLVKYIINPKQNKDKIKLFIKRLIYGASIFLISVLVSFIFDIIDQNINNQVFKCFNDPNTCNNVVKNVRNDNKTCDNISNKNKCCKFMLNNNDAIYNKDIDDCSIPISTLIND